MQPDTPVEIFATDEHRLGPKPITRRVWAPRGERPVALGHHRHEWLHVTACVPPTSGETFRYLSNGVSSKPFFEKLLATSTAEAGAGRERRIVLVLDKAGRHAEPSPTVPDGLRLVHLPRHSPELQPAECRSWPLLDEPLVDRHFATLAEVDRVVARRCLDLDAHRGAVKARTRFHRWPEPRQPAQSAGNRITCSSAVWCRGGLR